MAPVHMVPYATPDSPFEAKILVARLGAEGVLCQIKGSVDGMYPLGAIEVWVAKQDLSMAREIALADEVEQVFDEAGDDEYTSLPRPRWLITLVVSLILLFVLLRMASL